MHMLSLHGKQLKLLRLQFTTFKVERLWRIQTVFTSVSSAHAQLELIYVTSRIINESHQNGVNVLALA